MISFVQSLGIVILIQLESLMVSHTVDVSYPDIKKAGRTQIHQSDDRATITSSTIIKSTHKKKGKKNGKS